MPLSKAGCTSRVTHGSIPPPLGKYDAYTLTPMEMVNTIGVMAVCILHSPWTICTVPPSITAIEFGRAMTLSLSFSYGRHYFPEGMVLDLLHGELMSGSVQHAGSTS